MGVSTDGIICYGISLEEGVELPWRDEEWDNDEEEWWMYGVCGYKNPFELFTPEGSWMLGMEHDEEKHDVYYRSRREFREAHPLPIKVVRHCSGEYMMYIIAVPRTVLVASRGYPESFDPEDIYITDEEFWLTKNFCDRHSIEHDDDPKWWLCSMWW